MLSDQDRIANMLLSISKIKMLTQAKTEEIFQNSWEMQDLCCFHLSLIGEDAKLLSEQSKTPILTFPGMQSQAFEISLYMTMDRLITTLFWNSVTGDLIVLENALKEMKR